MKKSTPILDYTTPRTNPAFDAPPVEAPLRPRLWICAAVFIAIVSWAIIFPFSGDADSSLHFTTAQETWVNPAKALGAWARPLHKLLIAFPAGFGILPARITQALLTVALLWQTMKLAHDVNLPRPHLAGLFLIGQPYVFALASDTMTELPFALGLVIALRLWHRRQIALSFFVLGLLPLLRPEGFLVGPLWALMLLFTRGLGPWHKRMLSALPGLGGLIAWMGASYILTGNWRYFIDNWSWPAQSYEAYQRGHILHHVYLWPEYCGPVLVVFFIIGLKGSLRRKGMVMPWLAWAVVFVAHSLFFWGHWFASCGLLRILATTAPVTALVCHEGWLSATRWLERRHWSPPGIRRAGWTIATAACSWAMLRYTFEPDHLRCLPIRKAARVAMERGLVSSSPKILAGDRTFFSEIGLWANSPQAVRTEKLDRAATLQIFRDLPPGSIGLWDNMLSQRWYGVAVDELAALNLEILHEEQQPFPAISALILEKLAGHKGPLRCVLFRKK